jgi:hypothetical protein
MKPKISMLTFQTPNARARLLAFTLAAVALVAPLSNITARAQIASVVGSEDALPRKTDAPLFRMETIPVGRDAELLTVFGSLKGLDDEGARDKTAAPDSNATASVGDDEVPLVSILRDTLGDSNPENDRLRYVWMLTYTRPTALQRVASAVPFLYARVGDKKSATKRGMPPPVIDLASPDRDVWQRFMWLALQNVVFNPYGVVAKSTTGAYGRNSSRYRQAHIMRALAILSLYEAETGERAAFTPEESNEIQARLMLTGKTFGGLIDDAYLDRALRDGKTKLLDERGHNWELLRQRAETEGLYFEPLTMPDGGATHAIVYVAREDLPKNRNRKFGSRVLNIANPWDDSRLARLDGHVERRNFDADNRAVAEGTGGAREVELIPLALYGLDNPKIPALLVDFRNRFNPKRREMSHRVIEDVTRNLLALSRYGDIHYFLGRTVFDFVTSRRGIDVNQPTRLRAYSQLKLLLALDSTLDPDFREEIGRRVESVSLNPLENDLDAEAKLARQQYAALVEYAKDSKGLAARLDRDRREELSDRRHGGATNVFLRFANILSFGAYKHRESDSSEDVRAALDGGRRFSFHKRFLREVAKAPMVEVEYNIEDVRRSLRYVAEAGDRGDAAAARAAAKIFGQTRDAETRRLCVECLYRIDNEAAKSALLAIYRSPDVDEPLRQTAADYLRSALREERRIAPGDAKAIIATFGQ